MKDEEKIAIVSRSHAGNVAAFLSNSSFERWKVVTAGGSGYKALRVLNGTANMYIHVTDIKLWDLCAPNAIIRAAKGWMTNLDGLDISFGSQGSTVNERGVLVTRSHHFYYLSKIIPHVDVLLSKN
ncbi:unnamed protein product [Soboliphyme baturini]|uniref:inositol-phosphate phosphatase n=1 Tax=Soboliphyme baturini TaxID=241478 RepID=A0A183IA88_9BILA|nr:unnamed protein product [Soboliphyme baturini]